MSARDVRGGKQQRKRRLAELCQSHPPSSASTPSFQFDSKLAEHLVIQFSIGVLAAIVLQRIAQHSYEDQLDAVCNLGIDKNDAHKLCSQSLAKLVGLGNWGRCPSNCHRDLTTFLGEPDTPKSFQSDVHVLVSQPRCADGLS